VTSKLLLNLAVANDLENIASSQFSVVSYQSEKTETHARL
jgi:hypothetical protein